MRTLTSTLQASRSKEGQGELHIKIATCSQFQQYRLRSTASLKKEETDQRSTRMSLTSPSAYGNPKDPFSLELQWNTVELACMPTSRHISHEHHRQDDPVIFREHNYPSAEQKNSALARIEILCHAVLNELQRPRAVRLKGCALDWSYRHEVETNKWPKSTSGARQTSRS